MKNLKRGILRLIIVNIFLVTFIYPTTECNAQSTHRWSLLAISKTNHTLAIIDPLTVNISDVYAAAVFL